MDMGIYPVIMSSGDSLAKIFASHLGHGRFCWSRGLSFK